MKRKLLVIDDQSTQRRILREFLELSGHVVVGEGGNGKEAVRLSKELAPDLIIMDVKMPVMDGIKAAGEINMYSPIPIILNTVKEDDETVERAKEAGVMAYLVKPIREEELNPAIELAIYRFKEFQTLRKDILDLKDTLETRKIVEKAKGMVMEKEGFSEGEAFRTIQRMSMNKQKPMKEMAEAIIMAYEIRKAG